MPSITETYPSKWIKAADLQGRAATVTITAAPAEKVGDDIKIILAFTGKEKRLPLNKTNASILASIFGDNSDLSVGKQIVLMPSKTSFGGKVKDTITIQQYVPVAPVETKPPPIENPPDAVLKGAPAAAPITYDNAHNTADTPDGYPESF